VAVDERGARVDISREQDIADVSLSIFRLPYSEKETCRHHLACFGACRIATAKRS
jgi:hypothetical protein